MIKNAEYKLTVVFSGSDTGSTLSVTQENFKDDETMKPHREGWDKGLEALKQYLEQKSSTPKSVAGNEQSTGGYREAADQQKVAGG